jgi:hypothetical protein
MPLSPKPHPSASVVPPEGMVLVTVAEQQTWLDQVATAQAESRAWKAAASAASAGTVHVSMSARTI